MEFRVTLKSNRSQRIKKCSICDDTFYSDDIIVTEVKTNYHMCSRCGVRRINHEIDLLKERLSEIHQLLIRKKESR